MKRSIMCVVALMLSLCMLIPAEIITADAKEKFYSSATTVSIKEHIEEDAGLGTYATAQGSCTDGKFAYFAINDGTTTLLKYDTTTWKLVKKSKKVNLDHANDMTYNSKKDVIVVAHNAPNYNIISYIDPDTLKVIKTRKIKYKIYSISYNEKYDRYVVGLSGTYNFAILNSSFKLIKKHKGYKSGYVRQGADSDNDYIYFVQSGGGGNLIVIYNWSGKLIDTISVDKSLEIENIFHVKNCIYITLHYYGNYIYRIGISNKTAIKYKISFEPNGAQGYMKDITVTYSKEKALPKCTYEKEDYFFGGWIIKRNNYNDYYGKKTAYSDSAWLKKNQIYEYSLFSDCQKVKNLVKYGNVTATAFWISNKYRVYYDSNGGEGHIPLMDVNYNDVFSLSENTMTKNGYIFTGWTARRDYDSKVYGYAKGKKVPKWLDEKDAHSLYVFEDGQKVSKLTYDLGVTFSAKWQLAFNFSKDGEVLNEYIGTDEDVIFPKENESVREIAKRAFADNETMVTVTIPETIDTLGDDVFSGCVNLNKIYFDHAIPEKITDTSLESPLLKKCYLKTDTDDIFIGYYTGRYLYNLFLNKYSVLFI